jgi:hypothetical protein
MKWFKVSFLLVCAALLWASGIIPAIIPQAVPTANKIGNSTKFQLGATGAVSGDCATFDASLNITGPGTGAGCGKTLESPIAATFTGAGSTLTPGTVPGVSLSYIPPLPFACTAVAWTVTVDTGTAGFRVWRVGAGTAVPVVGDSITTADLAITSNTNLRSTTFTNFSGSVAPVFAANDVVAVQLNAATSATVASFSIQCQ